MATFVVTFPIGGPLRAHDGVFKAHRPTQESCSRGCAGALRSTRGAQRIWNWTAV